ncbi:hypothetical protein [Glaciibacter sp. 2TAF33]
MDDRGLIHLIDRISGLAIIRLKVQGDVVDEGVAGRNLVNTYEHGI